MRLGPLIDGMFDTSMLDLRAGVSRSESTELQTSITAAIHAVAPIAADRGARVVQLAFGTGDVATNVDRLTQILLNLSENAVKHGRDGGVVFVSVVALDERYVEFVSTTTGRASIRSSATTCSSSAIADRPRGDQDPGSASRSFGSWSSASVEK